MPGVDHDSLALFKEAKTGKRVFFALVVKGGTAGKLMANKTSKVPPGDITEAKKEVGGSAVVQGRCQGENGGLVFETAKETSPAIATLTKKLLKDAGWMVDLEYRVNSEGEEDGEPVPTTTSTGPQIGRQPLPQGTSMQGQTTSTPPKQTTQKPTEGLTLGMGEVLQPRLLAVGRWMKEKKTELPDVVGRMEHAFMEAGTAFKNHDYETCEPIVVKLEEVIRRVKGQGGQRGTQQQTQGGVPPTTSTTPPIQTRPRSVSTPGEVPISPGQQARTNVDNAKQEVEAYKANPNATLQTPEAREKISNLKSEMIALVGEQMEAEDDIKRKGGVFDSIDANYKKNVTAVVQRTMKAVRPALEDPAADPDAAIKLLEQGLVALAQARAHYADMKDITDREHLDQRRRKVEAIDAHMTEMRKITGKLRQILKMKAQPVLDLLAKVKELNDADPDTGGPELKEFGKLLADESTRKAVFQSVGIEQAEALLAMMDSQDSTTLDRMASELAKTRASDSDFMDPFCKTAITKEAAKATDKGTFFRGNSLATKLSANYVMNSPNGKAYTANVSSQIMDRTKGKGPLEVDGYKDEKLKPKDIEKNIEGQKKMLGPIVDDLTSDPNAIPPEMAKIAAIFYDEAMRVSGNDEEFATTQAGGFIMLRVVNPAMTRTVAELTESKKGSDKAKAEKDQRLVTLQAKILQNMSNGAPFDKEPFMKPFEDQVFGENGGFAPQTAKLRGFLKGVAQNAPRN